MLNIPRCINTCICLKRISFKVSVFFPINLKFFIVSAKHKGKLGIYIFFIKAIIKVFVHQIWLWQKFGKVINIYLKCMLQYRVFNLFDKLYKNYIRAYAFVFGIFWNISTYMLFILVLPCNLSFWTFCCLWSATYLCPLRNA